MPDCTFDKCCCCIDLRVGCLIIGYMSLVGEIVMAAMVGMMFVSGAVLLQDGKAENREVGAVFLVIGGVLLLALIVAFIFTILLLVGVHKERRGYVKAYLIGNTVIIILELITLIGMLGYGMGAPIAVRTLMRLALNIYFLLCVRSHYYKMGDTNSPAVFKAVS